MVTLRKAHLLAPVLVVALVAGSGCHRRTAPPINPSFTPSQSVSTSDTPLGLSGIPSGFEDTNSFELPNVDLASISFNKDNSLVKPIYFDYDSYELRPDALETLRANAEVLKQTPGNYVQVEGHCDERGTSEYNLALGDKRAQTTREQLIRLGVSGDRIVTITYGEEAPVDLGHDESAWAQNRRCEFSQGRKN
ncbi:MAG: peptidoglycan-associated lipoprotein Pal [Candidatus Hydrogenedentes bacterium]|nr:peptidoglycan-associated lipoprotein Pal [Candidatus Hydrogenedentota bacterium]